MSSKHADKYADENAPITVYGSSLEKHHVGHKLIGEGMNRLEYNTNFINIDNVDKVTHHE